MRYGDLILAFQIESYAGRIAAENPATELAQVLDDHADDFRRVFSANVEAVSHIRRPLSRGAGVNPRPCAAGTASHAELGDDRNDSC